MAGNRRTSERQGRLWGGRSLNPILELKRALNIAAKDSSYSRAELVDRLNAVIAVERLRTKGKDGLVTAAMLDKWLAPEASESLPPLKLLPALCLVLDSLAPLQALAGPVGGLVIGEADQMLLEMAQAMIQEKEAGKKRRRLEEQWKERRS